MGAQAAGARQGDDAALARLLNKKKSLVVFLGARGLARVGTCRREARPEGGGLRCTQRAPASRARPPCWRLDSLLEVLEAGCPLTRQLSARRRRRSQPRPGQRERKFLPGSSLRIPRAGIQTSKKKSAKYHQPWHLRFATACGCRRHATACDGMRLRRMRRHGVDGVGRLRLESSWMSREAQQKDRRLRLALGLSRRTAARDSCRARGSSCT